MRSGDSRKWSAEEMLEDLLEQIRTGAIKPKQIAVHWFDDTGDEKTIGIHDYIISMCSLPEHLLLLQIGQAKMMDELRGPLCCED